MGETSKYFVPNDDSALIGKEHEVAEAFWKIGLFLATEDRFIYRRIEEWKKAGRPLPASAHDFGFAEMGLGGSRLYHPVPNCIYDLACPECAGELAHAAYAVWEDNNSEVALPLREIICPYCQASTKSSELKSQECFVFSRLYLWIADVAPYEWDTSFKATVESILGPCQKITSWET